MKEMFKTPQAKQKHRFGSYGGFINPFLNKNPMNASAATLHHHKHARHRKLSTLDNGIELMNIEKMK